MNEKELKDALVASEKKAKELGKQVDSGEKALAEANLKIKEYSEIVDPSADLKKSLEIADEKISALEAELKTAKEEISGLKASGAKDVSVKGAYPSKEHGKVSFEPGYTKTRLKNGEVISSEEALKDEELMEWLIEIDYAGLKYSK